MEMKNYNSSSYEILWKKYTYFLDFTYFYMLVNLNIYRLNENVSKLIYRPFCSTFWVSWLTWPDNHESDQPNRLENYVITFNDVFVAKILTSRYCSVLDVDDHF